MPPRFDDAETDEIGSSIIGNISHVSSQITVSNTTMRNGCRNDGSNGAASSSASTMFNIASPTSTTNGGASIVTASSSSSFNSTEREMRLLRRNQRVGHRQRIPDSLRFRDKAKMRSCEAQTRQGSSTPTGVIISSNDTTVESTTDINGDDLADMTAEMDEMDREFVALQDELIEEGILLGAASVTNDDINMNTDEIGEANTNEDDNMSEDSDDNAIGNHRVLI